jgi:hypothetical protein
MRRRFGIVPILFAVLFTAACEEVTTPFDAAPQFAKGDAAPASFEGVNPTGYPGNFVASDDDQVCYELSSRNMLGGLTVTSEMHGFKVNIPDANTNAYVSTALSTNGRELAWTAASGVTVLAAIIKGGPNFHLYGYTVASYAGLGSDSRLVSPLNGRNIPAVSHYNFCYTRVGTGEGCTPGYWRNHADRWVGVASSASFDATFGVTSGLGATYTLGAAIWATGGGVSALARHATAALLNAHGGVPNGDGTTVAFPLTPAQVIAKVQAAFENGTIDATKDELDALNNAGCPLSGTRAVDVTP